MCPYRAVVDKFFFVPKTYRSVWTVFVTCSTKRASVAQGLFKVGPSAGHSKKCLWSRQHSPKKRRFWCQEINISSSRRVWVWGTVSGGSRNISFGHVTWMLGLSGTRTSHLDRLPCPETLQTWPDLCRWYHGRPQCAPSNWPNLLNHVSVNASIGESLEYVHPYFSSSVLYGLLVLFGWFYRWEVDGRSAAAL